MLRAIVQRHSLERELSSFFYFFLRRKVASPAPAPQLGPQKELLEELRAASLPGRRYSELTALVSSSNSKFAIFPQLKS
jgi:hypothetical protein